MELSNEIKELSQTYIGMCNEQDAHTGTEERDAERTKTHNALIGAMNQAGLGLPHRVQVRQLARYILANDLKDLAQKPENGILMFRKRGTNVLDYLIPFEEQSEEIAMKLYEPVWVQITPVILEDEDENLQNETRQN